MKKQNIILLIVVVIALVSVFYSFMGSQDQASYVKLIEEERAEKERYMKTSKESPFAEQPAAFEGLKYFPPDIKYKITADLTPIKNKQVVLLPTSDGKEERYVEYGYAEFDFDGYHNKLIILEMVDIGAYRGKLFLAFGDETSALETYGAGRYLDVSKAEGSNVITLDFNQAYNPFCAYNEKYSCPLPPKENLLNVAIRAGEKNYHTD